MNKLAYKLAVGMATATVALGLFAGSAFAAGDVTCTISGNGHHSRNACIILVGRRAPRDEVVQINRARVFNGVVAVAATGGNTANGNTTTGTGGVSVDTGNAAVTVTITNTINQNTPPTP